MLSRILYRLAEAKTLLWRWSISLHRLKGLGNCFVTDTVADAERTHDRNGWLFISRCSDAIAASHHHGGRLAARWTMA